MTLEIALQLLNSVVAKVPLTRQDHKNLKAALKLIADAINVKLEL